MLKSEGIVIVRGNSVAVILYFYRLKPLILESYICMAFVSELHFGVAGSLVATNARGSSVEAVLHQLLHNGAQVNNDLTGLDLMDLQAVSDVCESMEEVLTYRPALYRLYGGHGMVA